MQDVISSNEISSTIEMTSDNNQAKETDNNQAKETSFLNETLNSLKIEADPFKILSPKRNDVEVPCLGIFGVYLNVLENCHRKSYSFNMFCRKF